MSAILEKIFNNNINQIHFLWELVSTITENPDNILLNLYPTGEDNLLSYMIKKSDKNADDSINELDFQIYIYEELIIYLKKHFSEYSFTYDYQEYPAKLYFVDSNSKKLASIDIYNHIVITYEDESLKKVRGDIEQLEQLLYEKTEQIEEKRTDMKYILSTAKNPIQMMDMLIRQKTYIRNAKSDYKSTNEELIDMEVKLRNLRNKYNRLVDDTKADNYKQKKICEYFKNKYKYSYMKV